MIDVTARTASSATPTPRMTPDFLAGLLIGSFAVYACWLLSLRLAEPEDRLPGEAVALVHDGKHRDADTCSVCHPELQLGPRPQAPG